MNTKSRLSEDDLQREVDADVEHDSQESLSSERDPHGEIDREHSSRVDDLLDERATHPEDDDDEPWVRPSNLEAPPARPGMVQRWIRISVRGADDPRNISLRTREGWSPRAMDTVPEEYRLLSGQLDSKQDTSMGRFIVDDLLLCEMPIKKHEKRNKYYADMTDRQMEAVEHDLESSQIAGHRIVKTHKSTVSMPPRVVGRRVEPADD